MRAPKPYSSFFREQAPIVSRYLSGTVGPDDRDECLQETFLAALRAYDDFDGVNPRGWILTIARRKAIDCHRSRVRRRERAIAEGAESVAASGERLDGDIWIEVASLPEKQRTALVLRYALDLPHREIGAVLDCSEAAARRNVHEGIKRLRAARVNGDGEEARR